MRPRLGPWVESTPDQPLIGGWQWARFEAGWSHVAASLAWASLACAVNARGLWVVWCPKRDLEAGEGIEDTAAAARSAADAAARLAGWELDDPASEESVRELLALAALLPS